MEPLKLIETTPGNFSLILSDGAISDLTNKMVEQHGHLANGYFWEGVARTALRPATSEIKAAIHFDCEAGMFCAYASDRAALEYLGRLMSVLATRPDALQELMRGANPADFDD